jgi:hypothetical protein
MGSLASLRPKISGQWADFIRGDGVRYSPHVIQASWDVWDTWNGVPWINGEGGNTKITRSQHWIDQGRWEGREGEGEGGK